jgi:hypothetical protein
VHLEFAELVARDLSSYSNMAYASGGDFLNHPLAMPQYVESPLELTDRSLGIDMVYWNLNQ